jgi:hypothetical protein
MAILGKTPTSPAQPPKPPEISTRPRRIRWSIADLLTSDGHRISAGFVCGVAVVDEPAERKLLAEVFANPQSLTAEAVIAHFLPSLQSAGTTFCAGETAEHLLGPDAKPRWAETLRKAANEVGFNCGLEVLAPFETEITSPTLQRERLEQMQRTAAERRSADRAGHFAKAAELLRQWEQLKSEIPSVTPGKLLEQINPADRGLMLDTLLMAGGGNPPGQAMPGLWAVSGPYLVRVDVKIESPQPRLITLASNAGPLRSVVPSDGKLLVGAQSGVMIVDPRKADVSQLYLHPTLASEHGFTSATQIGNRLWACHRAAGLVGWRFGAPDSPEAVLAPTQLGGEPKHLTGAGLFAMGSKLCRLAPTLKIEPVLDAGSPIVAILATEGQTILACENGGILVLDSSTLETIGDIQTTGKLSGAALLPWLSSSRLLLNRADGAIDCIGLEDQLLTQFNSGQTGMRAVAACGGKVAAMSADRQRLLLWNPWDGRKTAGEIYLTGITHHRIADLVFA